VRWLKLPLAASELVVAACGEKDAQSASAPAAPTAAAPAAAPAPAAEQPPIFPARRLRSEPGKHDGLYWEIAEGEPESPAGPALANAAAEGYAGTTAREPYHGYLYRMLLAQGPDANGGAYPYEVDGKLTQGFALLAYPAAYGTSGVMTFIVNHDGVVWQRDLGDDTATAAAAIQEFNPDKNWTPIAPES
jgi:hypothetical protein